ncbi:MAG: DHH family phosphoesterase [Caryophanon sp.]|nr:DHH family phosphoesterase [Caryophanon sp.]
MGAFRKRPMRYPIIFFMLLFIVAAFIMSTNSIMTAAVFTLVSLAVALYAWRTEKYLYDDTEAHIETLSYRMNNVGEEAFLQMPIGIVLLNEAYNIAWVNPYMQNVIKEQSLVEEDVALIAPELSNFVKQDEQTERTVTICDRKYRVLYKKKERLLYFFDVTKQLQIETQYFEDRTVLAILFVDNYDEITSMMDDQARSSTNSLVTSILNDWAKEHDIFLKRISSDRFMAVLNRSILENLEEKKFPILDDVREKTQQRNVSLTLSIGVGTGSASLTELGQLAQSSLDLVLGRGGDQVAVKNPDGKLRFYGGKTNPIEKRTRVRARVISHALRDLIQDSDRVFVMGHKMPDLDSIGACIGVRKMASMNKVSGHIVVNFDELTGSVGRLMYELKANEELYTSFISPQDAQPLITEKSLLVIVDTHKPSLVVDPTILQHFEKVVVIDHHRRAEEFIENPVLVYMEPYASSTAELVTELLEYQPKHDKITMIEATALLSGIIVDTKSFTLRTGSRTFEAASYLRTAGADTVLVQRLLKEDIDTYIERSRIIQTVEFAAPGIAIAHGNEGEVYNSVLIAQTADILLTMKDISASFVVALRPDGQVGISARSLGETNVQLVMERLGGGGHLSNAAAQLPNQSLEDAIAQLKSAIFDVMEGSSET